MQGICERIFRISWMRCSSTSSPSEFNTIFHQNVMEILQNIPIEFDTEKILLHAHIKPTSRDGRELLELIETFRPHIQPKAVYRLCYIQSRQDNAVEFGGVRFSSRILKINLENTERVFPFILTAGTELEDLSHQHNDLLKRYCFDVLKETVLRRAGEYLRKHLKQTYALKKIALMNPGSLEDWPITEQKPLFSMFGDVKQLIGVELTESFLMYPVKSVSGIIFPTETTFENCQLCPREDCPGRRAPYEPQLYEDKYRFKV